MAVEFGQAINRNEGRFSLPSVERPFSNREGFSLIPLLTIDPKTERLTGVQFLTDQGLKDLRDGRLSVYARARTIGVHGGYPVPETRPLPTSGAIQDVQTNCMNGVLAVHVEAPVSVTGENGDANSPLGFSLRSEATGEKGVSFAVVTHAGSGIPLTGFAIDPDKFQEITGNGRVISESGKPMRVQGFQRLNHNVLVIRALPTGAVCKEGTPTCFDPMNIISKNGTHHIRSTAV